MSTARLPVLPAVVPPDDAYECTQCGSCCRRPWSIGVSDEEHARFTAIDWSRHAPHLAGRELFVRFGERAWLLGREASGACVFLEADDRCALHRVLGYAKKPESCQSFPIAFVETPTGARTRISWATEGRRVGEAPSDAFVEGELVPAFARDHAARATSVIDDEAALALTDQLARFIDAHEELDVVERVLRVLGVLDRVGREELASEDHAGVEVCLATPAKRGRRAPSARAVLLLALPVILTEPVRGRADLLNVMSKLARGLALGTFAPPHLSPPVPLDVLVRVRFADDRDSQTLWTAYVRDLVFDGLVHGGRRGQAEWLLRGFAHARWLAKWAVARDRREEVTAQDVRWALAEAEAFRGPHWGLEGRLARRLARAIAEVERGALLLDQLLRVEV